MNRLELHSKIVNIIDPQHPIHAYFQPPESVKLVYPAVVYYRARIAQQYADNTVYKKNNVYELTVIDKDPESEIVEKLSSWPRCIFDRAYCVDNLYHNVFRLYT